MASLILDNLSKTYTQHGHAPVHAVASMSLEVADGRCAVLTGASGSGKTTLLMMLAGLLEPTEGTITLGGRVLNHVRADQRNIAMVFQHDALYPHLSARKHLVISLKGEGVKRSEMNTRIARVADQLSITECLDRKPADLSGGQRRRVALARAMVRKADLLLLDEPLAGVDSALGSQIRAVLKEQWGTEGSTVLVVTHDAHSAAELGDSVILMQKERLESDEAAR